MKTVFVPLIFKLTEAVINFFKTLFILSVFGGLLGQFSGCAYKLSNKVDTLPGNTKFIFVPIYKNSSAEPGIEAYFTNSIKQEILNSSAVHMVNSEDASDAVLYGDIKSITYVSDASVNLASDPNVLYLPNNTVISTLTTIDVTVEMILKKKRSNEVLWRSEFKQSLNYTPPQITLPVLNSANSLYNLSARRQNIEILSKQMMQLAFDRMVDNF